MQPTLIRGLIVYRNATTFSFEAASWREFAEKAVRQADAPLIPNGVPIARVFAAEDRAPDAAYLEEHTVEDLRRALQSGELEPPAPRQFKQLSLGARFMLPGDPDDAVYEKLGPDTYCVVGDDGVLDLPLPGHGNVAGDAMEFDERVVYATRDRP